MRQTYEIIGGRAVGAANLPQLRRAMAAADLAAFYVPHDDEYQNEYLPECAERLCWATGFSGSAGAAVILGDTAAVFVDGRYTLQAADQLDPALFEVLDLTDPGPFGWLAAQKLAGARVGYDPRLVSPDALEKLLSACRASGAEAVATSVNPIDLAWSGRPGEPLGPALPHPLEYAGRSSRDKRHAIASDLRGRGWDAVVLTSPPSIAWLFNIRGSDVPRTPLALARAILRADGSAELFMRPEKHSPALVDHLGADVTLLPTQALEDRLKALKGARVSLDPALASAWFFETLSAAGAVIERSADPCIAPRARKNEIELEGARRAHRRDGAALSRFLRWIAIAAPAGNIDEIAAAQRLEAYREETGCLKDLSFDSISSAGPNGAITHYRPNVATNRRLEDGSLYLIDSGGQYPDGTTDVTRTVAIGAPTAEMRDRFTRVLKGHIALARVRFPRGTSGSALDALARVSLWDAGVDYDHGTGHGVGSYLGVHEGPHRIAKAPNAVALEPGMVVSNEPGYYKAGAYGIRIENLQAVTAPGDLAGGERPMMGFETLTLAPIDRNCIEASLLTADERAWLNAYHARVLSEIGPQLGHDDRVWLEQACADV
jgi:Xaa-Pro aminopeptidase